MNTNAEAEARHLQRWNDVLGADCHLGGCRYARGGIVYDLSAADPNQWSRIRDEGLFVLAASRGES